MEYRRLGKSGLNISTLVLGGWQYGCKRDWGEISERNIQKVILESIESGINAIDTAITYGDSEIIIGKYIKPFRDEVIIITKCGADPKKIPLQLDYSLKRLGLEYIDLYLVHYPDLAIPIEETIGAMVKLKKAGKIKNIGVSNFSKEQLIKATSETEIACCESAFNLLWKEIEVCGVTEFCVKNNIGILTYSSLGQGLFTGRFKSLDDIPKSKTDIRHITVLFKEEAFKTGLEIVNILEELSEKYEKTVSQIALNWVLYQNGITSAIVGIESTQQLTENIDAIGWKMSENDYRILSLSGNKSPELFDYSSYNMFGMKWDEIKIDQIIDESISD